MYQNRLGQYINYCPQDEPPPETAPGGFQLAGLEGLNINTIVIAGIILLVALMGGKK